MIKITIDDKEVQQMLKDLSGKVRNLRPAMKNIAGIMMDAVEENFEKQGLPKWEGLKPSTIRQRQKEGKWPGRILQKSAGGLAPSISSGYDGKSAQVGTNKKYAAIHQFGGKAGRGKKVTIPARPFLKLQDGDMTDIKDALKTYLLKGGG